MKYISRKKKLTSVFAWMYVVVLLFSISACENGSTGLDYKLNNNGEYIVSGIGSCEDTEIVIPKKYKGKSVTGIGEGAFSHCTQITSVVLPDSILSIGNFAFYECSKLQSITMANELNSIGISAFEYCSGLKTYLKIPDSVTFIEKGAFVYSGVTSVRIGKEVEVLQRSAFEGCANLTSVTLPDSIITFETNVFYNCENLERIYFENTEEVWQSVGYEANNGYLSNVEKCYYSVYEPLSSADGRYWKYDENDNIVLWN